MSNVPISIAGNEEVVSVFKAPTDPVDKNRCWVIHIRNCQNGVSYVIKIYPETDKDFCIHETNIAHLLRSSHIPITTPLPISIPRKTQTNVVVSNFKFIPGIPLSSRADDILSKCKIICGIIKSFAETKITISHDKSCQYSKNQGFNFWTAPLGYVATLSYRDHLHEFEKDIARATLIGEEQVQFYSIWKLLMNKYGDIADSVKALAHCDLNSDNIIITCEDIAVIDVGLAVHTSLFLEWGGIVAHLGIEVWDEINSSISQYIRHKHHVEMTSKTIEHLTALFAVKRAVRRVAYLSHLSKQPGADKTYIRQHLERQMSVIRNMFLVLKG
jgi:hypothetical protein